MYSVNICSSVFTKSDPHSPRLIPVSRCQEHLKEKVLPAQEMMIRHHGKWQEWIIIFPNQGTHRDFFAVRSTKIFVAAYRTDLPNFYAGCSVERGCRRLRLWEGVWGCGGGVWLWRVLGRCGINCRHCTLDIYTLIGRISLELYPSVLQGENIYLLPTCMAPLWKNQFGKMFNFARNMQDVECIHGVAVRTGGQYGGG